MWLAPEQVRVAPIADEQHVFAKEVVDKLQTAGIRVGSDFRNEKLGFKIREAQLQKIPFMLVIGDREVETRQVSPRQRDGKTLDAMGADAFIALVREKSGRFQ